MGFVVKLLGYSAQRIWDLPGRRLTNPLKLTASNLTLKIGLFKKRPQKGRKPDHLPLPSIFRGSSGCSWSLFKFVSWMDGARFGDFTKQFRLKNNFMRFVCGEGYHLHFTLILSCFTWTEMVMSKHFFHRIKVF